MLTAINTKLLIGIVLLLAGISSYLAYQRHLQNMEQQKVDRAFEQMRTEGPKSMPSGWAKSLKNK
jgi:hypothetical protein